MAISLANTLTSRLWRGEPKVVIRGKFSLGLVSVSGGRLAIAPFLYFGQNAGPGLASSVQGKTFSLQIEGRQDTYVSAHDGHLETGISAFDSWAYLISDQNSPCYGVDPYYAVYQNNNDGTAVYPGLVPSVQAVAMAKSDHVEFSTESNARIYYSSLGTVVAELRIILRGQLQSLDLSKIQAVGFHYDSSLSRAELSATHQTTATIDGVSQSTGWHPVDVRIYDNPQLRGHVTAGDVPVMWE